MLNRSASLAMSTSVLKVLPGKLDIKDTNLVFSICLLTSQQLEVLSLYRFQTLKLRSVIVSFGFDAIGVIEGPNFKLLC